MPQIPLKYSGLRRLRSIGALVILMFLAVGTVIFNLSRVPPPPVIRPQGGNVLDPQVSAYLGSIITQVEASPKDPLKRATLGLAYAANGLWSEARQTFKAAAKLDPGQPLAPLYAAVALQELADERGALIEFRQLASHFPDFGPAWYRLGEAWLRQGDSTNAQAAFRQLIRLAPHEWRGPAGLAEAILREGRTEEALPLLEKAVQMDWSARSAHYLLGRTYQMLGRTNDARLSLALGRAAERHPMPDPWSEQAPIHMRLVADQLAQAEELCAAGRPEVAADLMMRALSFHPRHPGLLNELAVALNRADHPQEALTWVNQALAVEPELVSPRITRALIHARLGEFDLGLADAQEALKRAPKLAQAHLASADIWLAQDRDSEAIEALREAMRCEPENAEIRVELGDVYWHNLGEKKIAIGHFLDAIHLNPALSKAYVRIGLLQREMGDLEAARETLSNLVKVAPYGNERKDLEMGINQP